MGLLFAFIGLFAIAGPTAAASGAEFNIEPGSFVVKMLDAEGNPESRAGSHPDLLQMNFALKAEGTAAKDFVFELPPGLGGNPGAVQECPRALFDAHEEDCPASSQVGVFKFVFSEGQEAELPMFQVEPGPGEFLTFGSIAAFQVPMKTELRQSDFGVTMRASDIPQLPVKEAHLELWGVPANHQPGATGPGRPLFTTPTRCGPLNFTFRTRSWEEGAPWLSASTDTGAPLSGCADLSFEPKFGLGFSNPVADSPTGLRMDLTMPDGDDARGLAGAQMKDVSVEMPPGLGVSPAGAERLTACSNAQFGIGSNSEANCPASSKLGTMEFASPALHGPLTGTIYLGEEREGERIRMLIAAPGPGVVIKSVGALSPDPASGRIAATLRDLPQVAVTRLSMNLDGGADGLLASPLACGPVTASASFVPYGGGARVDSAATVSIANLGGLPCTGPPPFAPEFITRGSSHRAGRPTSFSATLRRRDGEQLPRRFSVTLPAGLSTALGAVSSCPDAGAATGACPPESKVGSVRAEVGSGPKPAVMHGDAYLAGPYRRAPFSVVMAFHATIGPFDLGTMAMRTAAQVDKRSGKVTMATDRIPDLVEGLPVRFQSIEFALDRTGLVRNPTSCAARSVDATIEAGNGALAKVSSSFLVNGCKKLGFKPHVQLAFVGGGELRKGTSPGLRFSVRTRPGDTNLKAMKFSFPGELKLDVSDLGAICSRPDAVAGLCPLGSRVGTAKARTALLSKPLAGSVYVVQPRHNDDPPDVWTILTAMGLHLSVKGTTAAVDGHFVTKLAGLPDMPLSAFTMRLGANGKGLFSLGSDPCLHGHPRQFLSSFSATGQNGVERELRLPIRTKARCPANR